MSCEHICKYDNGFELLTLCHSHFISTASSSRRIQLQSRQELVGRDLMPRKSRSMSKVSRALHMQQQSPRHTRSPLPLLPSPAIMSAYSSLKERCVADTSSIRTPVAFTDNPSSSSSSCTESHSVFYKDKNAGAHAARLFLSCRIAVSMITIIKILQSDIYSMPLLPGFHSHSAITLADILTRCTCNRLVV